MDRTGTGSQHLCTEFSDKDTEEQLYIQIDNCKEEACQTYKRRSGWVSGDMFLMIITALCTEQEFRLPIPIISPWGEEMMN